jgi:hypothetical protein
MSSEANGKRPSLRKLVAQAGVLIFTTQMLLGIFGPLVFPLLGGFFLPFFLYFQFGLFILAIAAVLPMNPLEEWGSMWPLVGYDNAIDAIYTRGPWWVRFEELDEQERQKGVIDGMNRMFGAS